MPTRTPFLAATLNGVALPNILSARCSFGYDMQVSEATVYVPVSPGFQLYDQNLVLRQGAGTNNVTRFDGLFRKYDYTLYPRMLGLVCYGHLIRAQQYENSQQGAVPGGLELNDIIGATTSTDQAAVVAALNRVPGLSFSAGNIGGTGVVFGGVRNASNPFGPSPWFWRSGSFRTTEQFSGSKGETALEYCQRWDAVSAVYTNNTAPSGFYRLYEQVGGTIRRSLLGSRPRSVIDFTFTEGIDIWQGSSSREYPIANRVYVQGFDTGLIGPVSNILSTTIQSNNPFMPQSEQHTFTFSSPMIERPLDSSPGIGMSCETVANALMLDVNRETVRCDFTTTRDDLIGPGSTVLVQGPGGAPDRLGIGEPLWVTHVDVSVDTDGSFSQRLSCLGGGLPDAYTPAPPI